MTTSTGTCLATFTPRLQFEVLDQTGKNDFEGESPLVGPLDWSMAKGISLYLGRHSTDKIQSNNLIFKNKVVSRQHAEVWAGDKDKVFIRDLGSSSGTFLNSQRLSPANTQSEPFQLTDGDILRIGTTYHGGIPERFRCINLRVRIFYRPRLNTYAMEDCCLCLYNISAGQAMFVTPCGHIFHYKCCRPLLHIQLFRCPVCRTVSNLNLDVN